MRLWWFSRNIDSNFRQPATGARAVACTLDVDIDSAILVAAAIKLDIVENLFCIENVKRKRVTIIYIKI